MGFLISGALAAFGLDATRIQADRIVSEYQPDCLLTAFLRFSQAGRGQWRTLLGGTTLIGRVFSLLTINLFLPPSQLLVHPFLRFYANSPRSPALHYAVAKQVGERNLTVLNCKTYRVLEMDRVKYECGRVRQPCSDWLDQNAGTERTAGSVIFFITLFFIIICF